MLDGKALTGADRNGAMLGEGLAAGLQLRPGDSLTVLLNTPDGALNSLDLVATVYHALGVPESQTLADQNGRPVFVRPGKAIHELLT